MGRQSYDYSASTGTSASFAATTVVYCNNRFRVLDDGTVHGAGAVCSYAPRAVNSCRKIGIIMPSSAILCENERLKVSVFSRQNVVAVFNFAHKQHHGTMTNISIWHADCTCDKGKH